MCNLHQMRLSRRRFLQWGVGTGLAMGLMGCRQTAVVLPTPSPLKQYGVMTPLARADVAGLWQGVVDGHLMLASPLEVAAWPLSAQLLGEQKEMGAWQGKTAAVWVVDGRATAVQLLPPMAATTTIPVGLAQGEMTGEKRPFGPLDLITRVGWGAATRQWWPNGESGVFDATANPAGWLIYDEPLADWLNSVVVHHAALEFMDGPREIQRLHMLQNRFADVGYHFLIDAFGQLYEGRPMAVRGAHTGGFNTGTIGVCLLGNFEVVLPTQRQLDTLQQLLVYVRDRYTITHMAGHRDFQPGATVCPGEQLWPLLADLAVDSGLIYGTDGYVRPDWAG